MEDRFSLSPIFLYFSNGERVRDIKNQTRETENNTPCFSGVNMFSPPPPLLQETGAMWRRREESQTCFFSGLMRLFVDRRATCTCFSTLPTVLPLHFLGRGQKISPLPPLEKESLGAYILVSLCPLGRLFCNSPLLPLILVNGPHRMFVSLNIFQKDFF